MSTCYGAGPGGMTPDGCSVEFRQAQVTSTKRNGESTDGKATSLVRQ